MYYLQHRRLQHTCNASYFKRTLTQKTNLLATYHTNNTLSHSPICNPKNAYIMCFPFMHMSQRLECIVINDQLPHVLMSSPIIETSRNSSYTSQESVITISIMISLQFKMSTHTSGLTHQHANQTCTLTLNYIIFQKYIFNTNNKNMNYTRLRHLVPNMLQCHLPHIHRNGTLQGTIRV